MKYLVTGCCGFIGKRLCQDLLHLGHQVTGLDNLSTGNKTYLPPEVNLVVGDIRDHQTVTDAIQGVDGCFHLAAIASVAIAEDDPIYAHSVNAQGTLNIFHASQQHSSIIPIVYASSAAVYGETGKSLYNRKVCPISIYGADKAINEYHAKSFWHSHQQPSCGLRLFNVYGPGQNPASAYSGVITRFITSISQDKELVVFGDGNQSRDFIHVSDVTSYMIKAMNLLSLNHQALIYDICSGSRTSINQLIAALSEITGSPLQPRYLPNQKHDIEHSIGNPTAATTTLVFKPQINLFDGLQDLWKRAKQAEEHLP